MSALELTATQIIRIHGWFNFEPFIVWDHVIASEKLDFAFLQKTGLTSSQLHMLQPDISEWIKQDKVNVNDCLSMTLWPLHPIHHLRLSLLDIVQQKWKIDDFLKLGITASDLFSLGLDANFAKMFGFTAIQWKRLGMKYDDVQTWKDAEISKVFLMNRHSLINQLA